MAHRCSIGIKNKDGSITAIYCYGFGSVGGVGETLLSDYTNESKVRKLLNLGDIARLGVEPIDDNGKCYCWCYKKADSEAKTFKTKRLWQKASWDSAYLYLFNPQKKNWYYSTYYDKIQRFKEAHLGMEF